MDGNKIPKVVQELAVKWARDQITTAQLSDGIGSKTVNHTIYRAGVALREAVRAGLLK